MRTMLLRFGLSFLMVGCAAAPAARPEEAEAIEVESSETDQLLLVRNLGNG